MCGRYGLIYPDQIPERFDIEADVEYEIKPHYNIAPGRVNPVVISHSPNHVEMMKWGYVPFYAKSPTQYLINARAETIAEKAFSKKEFQFNRCIIPASGFYEWKREGKEKVPYYFHLKDEELFGFAGIYRAWKDAEGKETLTYLIITTEPNELMKKVHNRMPVILNKEDEKLWLSHDETEPDRLLPLLKPYKDEDMEAYVVSKDVNKPSNDSPELIINSK